MEPLKLIRGDGSSATLDDVKKRSFIPLDLKIILLAFTFAIAYQVANTWPTPRFPSIEDYQSKFSVEIGSIASSISKVPLKDVKPLDLTPLLIAGLIVPQDYVRGDAIKTPFGGVLTAAKEDGNLVNVRTVVSRADCVDAALNAGRYFNRVTVNGHAVKEHGAVGTSEDRAKQSCGFGPNPLAMSLILDK